MSSAEPSERQQILAFGVRRSIRYHMRRSGFFDIAGTIFSGTNVLFGSAAVATLAAKVGDAWPLVLSAVVAFTSTINLVVGLSRQARKHNDLAKRFVELEKKLTLLGVADDEQLRQLEAERLAIQADEPPIKRILDALCHNELCKAMGFDGHIYEIPWPQRWLAQFFRFDASGLKLKSLCGSTKADG